MNDNDVFTAFVRWLTSTLGVTVIRSHQSGPSPDLPYVMVNHVSIMPVRVHEMRIDYDEQTSGDIEARPLIEMEWFFSVHCYGDNPTYPLRKLLSASKLSQVMEPMFPDLVINRMSDIRHIPEYIDEKWEMRGQVDIYLRGVIDDGFIIDTIEEFEVNITKE